MVSCWCLVTAERMGIIRQLRSCNNFPVTNSIPVHEDCSQDLSQIPRQTTNKQ